MSKEIKRVAVFTSGGDAPGMNAAIRAVIRTGSYHGFHMFGIYRGYQGMIEGDIKQMQPNDVANIVQRGGTILKTARSKDFMTKEGRKIAHETLQAHNIDACIAIGGNGTYTGAEVFQEETGFHMIGLPGTIDNDIYGTDYTIGFDTAVNTAVEAVDKIRDTAYSHDRLFFVEVMGRHSGYIALYTGIASGAESVFMPEMHHEVDEFINSLKLKSRRKKLFNLIIVAEGNENGSAEEVAKIVKQKAPEFNPRVVTLGHLQRGGAPSAQDRILASRLGNEAILQLKEGNAGFALGIVNNEVAKTPFKVAINRSKSPSEALIDMTKILAL